MPSGPCPENHSGILEFLGLVHAQLTQKVKNKNTHKKIKLSKREALLLPQAWASGHWRAGKKDQGWRNLEVYSQHPLPASVTPGRLWSVIICIHKVLEATGESHGCREGLGAATPWHVHLTPRGNVTSQARVPGSRESARAGGEPRQELGELEARVHADGIAQLLPEDTLLAVVGQLQQVEAGGGSGQAAARLPLADGEEAAEDAAQGVPSVLIIGHFHTADGEGRLEVGEAQERGPGAAGHKLQHKAEAGTGLTGARP
uniref:Ubiquitin-protein ligase E3B isoform X1 n=1 Tax=Sus scrofa TaxID=9823 RepID=A0A480IJV6_PIG